ncbi:hypothetical protein TUN205_12222 [Pyrenophora tritici-repentis]|nr:hypothetical protein TUN205_12222 [Pyrenophora tritici-repentis]
MWEDNVEAPDDEVGITTATTYIARAIADYTDRPTADEELFWEFRQDFEGWTEAMFLRAQPIYTKADSATINRIGMIDSYLG